LPAPYDADDPARRQREAQALEEQPVAVALRDVLGLDDHVAEPLAGRDVDLDAVEADVLLLGEEALVRCEPRLRLRVPRARAHPYPLELAGERAPPRRGLLLLDREPRLLLLQPRRVVALERDALAAVELEDPAGDVVEEVAVVRDRDDGALVLGQEALEPRDRLGVEVVGRLVEEQQVRSGQEEPAERDAPPLSAGEGRHVAVAVRHAERVHRPVERRLEGPGVVSVDLLLHRRLLGEERVEVGVRLAEPGRDRVEAVEQVAERPDAVLDVAADVLGRIELRLLLEQPDRRGRRELRPTARRLVAAGHDPEERRLAGAVRSEDADLRPGQEREGDVVEHLSLRAVELLDPDHREDVVAHRRRR
jgi:hypothetical protein